jgi:NADH:ubiquinone oxidoreductase subunit H/NADH:ubiquinone oxidoreductase subunit 6 (subunit J)
MPNFIMSYLGSKVTPGEAGNQFWALIYVLIIFAGVAVAVLAMNWIERKALAHFQIRLGPMRVGPHGLLQPIADAVKLMLKEDIIPAEADQFVFWIAPLIGLLAAFTVYTVIPFGPSQAVSDMNIGILFMLGVSSLGVLGIVVSGWASNSHYPLIGALRSSAQMVSYEVAMGLAVVSAILMTSLNATGTGTLSMIGIVQAQQQQGVWFIFKFFPLGFLAFVIFAIAMIAETNRAPFDMAEAESELTAGYHTEYSGLRWSLFMLAEYAAMIAVSSIAVTLWLGGWMRPFPNLLHAPAWDFTLLALSRPDVSWPGSDYLCRCGAHAGAIVLQDSADRACRFCGAARLYRAAAAGDRGRRPVRGHERGGQVPRRYRLRILVCAQSRRLYVSVYLVSRDVAALPLRPIDEDRMESDAADLARRADRDCHCGGDFFMNPAMNSAFNAGMAPVATPWFFYVLAGLAVASGVAVITRRNAVHAALALIVTLLSVAGLYLMLYAPFVAGVQIIVYAGGIMVLFLFVIMLVNIERSSKERRFNRIWPVGLVAACALMALFVSAIVKGKALFPDRGMPLPESSNTQQIATLLYGEAGRMGQYTFAFEIASLLLLVAILGAVIMTKKKI